MFIDQALEEHDTRCLQLDPELSNACNEFQNVSKIDLLQNHGIDRLHLPENYPQILDVIQHTLHGDVAQLLRLPPMIETRRQILDKGLYNHDRGVSDLWRRVRV